jgi:mannose/cellobiose epimerase-like protein (N-acyl-D-glucosamine 2-epimerase family)
VRNIDDESRLWPIPEWCEAAGLSRGWFYAMPTHLKPRHAKFGRSLRIIETPREYGERMARLQAEQVQAAP